MFVDPVIQEIRAVRDAYAKEMNYDFHAMYRDLKELEKTLKASGWKFVSVPSKRPAKKRSSKRKLAAAVR